MVKIDLLIKLFDEDRMELLFKILSVEKNDPDIKIDEKLIGYLGRIVKQRIKVLKLDIEFTDCALLAVQCFCSVPGEAIFLLIDCLNKCEISLNKKITASRLCGVGFYPFGFYEIKPMHNFIDDFVKTRQVKYSKIY